MLDGVSQVAGAAWRQNQTPALCCPDIPHGSDTINDVLESIVGDIPADHFPWHGWRFEVVDMDGNRIDKVLASPVRWD